MEKTKIKIIAEIANAHQGNSETAIELAQKCAEAGADAVKFQIYFADEFLVKSHSRYQHFKEQSFSPSTWKDILAKANCLGIEIYADVFGLDAFNLALECKVDGYKIHSSDLSNTKLLRCLSHTDKKIFLAVGGSTIPEIKYALDCINEFKVHDELILMHGFQAYPTKIEDSTLGRLASLKKLFGEEVKLGYSDHVSGDDRFSTMLPLMAIPYGIEYIEKHVTLDRRAKGVDYYSSYEPMELKKLVADIELAESAIGTDSLKFSNDEKHYRESIKKVWVAQKQIPEGHEINNDDIIMKRSSNPIASTFYENIIGKKTLQSLQEDAAISKYDLEHRVLAVVVARLDSSRLPNKALLGINGEPAIKHLFHRLNISKEKGYIDTVAFCTTTEESDDKLVDVANEFPFKIYRGSVENVLSRMMLAIDDNQDHDIVLRITGDDILVDPCYVKKTIAHHLANNAHYTDAKKLPSGTEVEVFDSSILRLIYELSVDSSGTEYLTNYIKCNADQFCTTSLPIPPKHSHPYRLTLDTREDYNVIKKALEHFKSEGKAYNYTLDDICNYFEKYPEALKINEQTKQKTAPITVNTVINWSDYTKTPMVTVYITNHNYAKYIRQAIDSVLSQKFRDFELVIIDDGSTDGSRDIIESYHNNPKVTIVYQENKGLNVSCNIAIKLSRGRYIVRLDADDYLDENALLVMTNKLERQKNFGAIFPDYYVVGYQGKIISQEIRHDFSKVDLLDQPAHGACTMIRKKLLIELGGYNESFDCQDGYDLWLKLIKSHKVTNVNLPLFYYRQHNNNLSKKTDRILSTRHKIIKQHTKENEISSKSHLCILPIRSFYDETPLALRPFSGTTLLGLTLQQIKESENISHTILSSSDERILEYASKHKETIPLTVDKRPEALSNFNARIENTVDYLLDEYTQPGKYETITILNFEYPLRKPLYIDKAINTLYLFNADAVIAIEQKDANFYTHNGSGLEPFSTNRELRLERDVIYEESGGIHTVNYNSYMKHRNLLCGKVGHIVLDELSSKRVDSELDFRILEFLSARKK